MEKRTEGAWLIHHTKKLHDVNNTQDFEDIELAGKCGIFLSNLSASEESDLNGDKVAAIAKVSNVSKIEIDTIKGILEDAHLIHNARADGGLTVLGLTGAGVLDHTSVIFNKNNPNNFKKGKIDLAESISNMPKVEQILKEFICDPCNSVK